jgi:hypothetical protein
MKNKRIIAILLSAFIFTALYSQTNERSSNAKKCKADFDKEIGRDNYTDVETQPVFADNYITDSIFLTEKFTFKVPAKNHTDKEWVKFAYMIEKDGKTTFLKVLDPKSDKEIEDEAKRIVSLLPLYKPAMCGQDPVPTRMNIRFQMQTY